MVFIKITTGCLLKLLAGVDYRFSAPFLNFSAQHPSVSNSEFCESVGSRHIPTITTCQSHRSLPILVSGTRWISHVWIVSFCDTRRLHISRTQRAPNCVASYMRLLALLFLTRYLTMAAVMYIRAVDIVVCRGFQLFSGS